MNIAVIGGGINGIMTTWELLKQGHSVTLYEKGEVMKQTSSASSKLLHGGLRYLENYEFRLVREALKERLWWISQAPQLAQPLKFYIPIYKTSRRPAWIYKIGLWLYSTLAGKQNIGQYQSLSQEEMQQACPELKNENLIKGFSYFDAQMDDYQLGLWALEEAKKQPSLVIHEHAEVTMLDPQGRLTLSNGTTQTFDQIINVSGPWAEQLLKQSNIKSNYTLDLVRGSHIVIDYPVQNGYFLEIPNESRIFFVLPYQGKTLIGTTEHRQSLNEEVKPGELEIDYLINAYNYYFKKKICKQNIVKSFAGMRPLIKSADNANKATREYSIQQNQKVISVFGGKWTTSRQLGKKVAKIISENSCLSASEIKHLGQEVEVDTGK
ncbi:FAD-dependent oxidoreductase [Thiomicrorhabdus sp.]|uniref:glycerol-3-phosphate dehydrogenase/oxidase n=1 Tax=Thiomicrorhabdus sp. TaxID=2039724 RepID=UPI0035683050